MTATASAPAKDEPRYKPIHFQNFKLNQDGDVWASWFLRLPEGMPIAAVFDYPQLLAGRQGSGGKSMKVFDFLTIVTWDQKTMCECRVTEATDSVVILSAPAKMIDITTRSAQGEYRTEKYVTRFFGGLWRTYDLKENREQPRCDSVSKATAIRLHDELYPRRVTA